MLVTMHSRNITIHASYSSYEYVTDRPAAVNFFIYRLLRINLSANDFLLSHMEYFVRTNVVHAHWHKSLRTS